MQDMIGNESSRQGMTDAVSSGRAGVFFVHGPWGLGKRAFLESLVGGERGLVVESTVDGIRSVKSKLETAPLLEESHDVVVLDCDGMSVPAQDACLKLLEEPPSETRIWVHASDASGIGRALLSRRRDEFRWAPVSSEDMGRFAASFGDVDELLLEIAAGRPGCYASMRPDPRFRMLHDTAIRAMAGSNDPLLEPLPALLSEIDGATPLRETVFMTLCHAAKTDPSRSPPVLRFASKILSHPSMNAELHWFTALASMRA
jgi:hypothetical protein